jgi:hypothetical protein
VKRLRVESPLPLRSHGSISMNKALLAVMPSQVVQPADGWQAPEG